MYDEQDVLPNDAVDLDTEEETESLDFGDEQKEEPDSDTEDPFMSAIMERYQTGEYSI
jgi:hypothetical protein